MYKNITLSAGISIINQIVSISGFVGHLRISSIVRGWFLGLPKLSSSSRQRTYKILLFSHLRYRRVPWGRINFVL